MKALLILSVLGVVIGVPWAYLVLLAGGMSTVPKFSALDLAFSLPPALVTGILSCIGFSMAKKVEPVRRGFLAAFVIIFLICLATVAVLCLTYLDMN